MKISGIGIVGFGSRERECSIMDFVKGGGVMRKELCGGGGGGEFWPGKQWTLRVGVERNLGGWPRREKVEEDGTGGLQIGVDGKW